MDSGRTEESGHTEEAVGSSNRSIALLTTIDQTLSSASNALLLFVLAQLATVAQFGVISLLIAIVTAWVGFNRGAVGTPVLLVSNLTKRDIVIEAGYAVTWSLTSSLGAIALIVGVGLWTGELALALAFAVVVPVAVVQDVVRFPPIAHGKPMLAVAADGFWVVAMLVLFVVNLTGVHVPVEVAVLLWGLAGLIATAMLMTFGPITPHAHRLWAWWRTYAPARIRFGGAYALTPLTTAGYTLAVTAVAGAAVAGGLRGASTLFGPIAMLIMALPLVFVPHARRTDASAADQWRLLGKTSLITSGLTFTGTAVLLVIPDAIGHAVLGETWGPAMDVAPFIGAEAAANCWMVSVYAFLQAQGMSRKLFRLRVFHVTFQLSSAIVVAVVVQAAVPIAIALAVSCWITVLVALWLVRGVLREARDGAPAVAGHRV
jgi:O-antigen/teichoic acid export membrane protein